MTLHTELKDFFKVFIYFVFLGSSINLFGQCTGTIYDPGGTSNYNNNLNTTTTYTATTGNKQVITFTSFSTEATNDYLEIFDGSNTSAPRLAILSGTLSSPFPTYTSSGLTLTLRFVSNGSTNAVGYVATRSCCTATTAGGTVVGNQSICGGYDPTLITSSSPATASSGTISYQWQSSPNNSVWTDISGATSLSYDPDPITSTTYFRRKSRTSICNSWGANSNVISKIVNPLPVVPNAGLDQTKCEVGNFTLSGSTPPSGTTGSWSVVSGFAQIYSTSTSNTNATIQAGSSATLRWTISNGTCTNFDDVILTNNNTSCNLTCTNKLNLNGDLEDEGSLTNFPLNFQGTPAALIDNNNFPHSWAQRYGSLSPNTSTFQGAFYLKKTGAAGNPKSGSHMIYLKGNGFCLSPFATSGKLACGKTYQISVWVAAYSNTSTQATAPFALEANFGGTSVTQILPTISLRAPISTNWNSLNWQRYAFTVTLPSNGYDYADVYFTSYNDTHGIVLDDVEICEIEQGSTANAGTDIFNCSNNFNLNANIPSPGYTGTWSVVGGAAVISSTTSASTTATISSGSNARLRWTVTNGTCTSTDDVVLAFSNNQLTINNATICPSESVILVPLSCNGTLNWSTGSTAASIVVSPTTTTTYSVTCTPNNLTLNPGFESSNMANWTNWDNASTVTSNARTGSKSLKLDASTAYAGAAQDFSVVAGELITIKAWAKSSTINPSAKIIYKFYNSSWNTVTEFEYLPITSINYTQYTITVIAPPSAAFLQLGFESSDPSITYVDDVEVRKTTSCLNVATSTVTVNPGIGFISGPNNICAGNTAVLTASAGSSYLWSTGATTPSISVSPSATTTYSVTVTQGGSGTAPLYGGVNLGGLTNHLFFFANGSTDANWQGATKGFAGNVVVDGVIANERTSGGVPFVGTIITNASELGEWAEIIDQNNPNEVSPAQAYGQTNQSSIVSGLKSDLNSAFSQINSLPVTLGYSGVSSTSLNGLNTQNNISEFFVINVTSDFQVSSQINITGDANDYFILRWDTDANFSNGYNGQVKFQSGGAIVPKGNLKPSNFVHVAGDIDASGGGSNPPAPYPQGPRLNDGTGALVVNGSNFDGGGFFTGYWLTKGDPTTGETSSLSNAIFVGGWYTTTSSFSMTSGTSGVYVSRPPSPTPCIGSTSITLTVNSNPTASISGTNIICAGDSTTFTASGGVSYLWNTMETTESITESTSGTYTVTVTNASGCTSTATRTLTVNTRPTASISGTNIICTGNSTTFTASGGVSFLWNTTATTAAISINTSGTYTVTVTNAAGCTATSSRTLTINPLPGSKTLQSASRCGPGSVTLLVLSGSGNSNWYDAPTGGNMLATGNSFTTPVLNSTTTYYIEGELNGCISSTRQAITATINPIPTITLVAAIQTTVCEGTSTTLTANTIGATSYLWSSNANNATTQSILVTPTLPSSTYTVTVSNNDGCTTSGNTTINVTPKPFVSISGNATICQGNTTQLSPSTGGTWISNNSTVASVNNAGLVTGLSNGTATFTFTNSTTNCVSNNTNVVTVNPKPTVSVTGPSAICKLSTTQLSPSSGGTWTSNNPAIASVNNSGLVTGLSAGSATFTFTSTAGCVSNPTVNIEVDEKIGITISGDNDLCVGELSNLTASNNGGTWISSNTAVATINTNGQINAIAPGNTIITYQKQGTACANEATYSVMVNENPIVSISGSNIICGQNTTQLSPTSGGTWSSSNSLIASVTNNGLVTGLAAGTVNFIFTSTAGCTSNPSQNITINQKPIVVINGSSDVCLGNTLQLSPTIGGTWVSSNSAVASISNGGLVTSLAVGTVNFTFTNTNTGCVSDASGNITVRSKPTISINYNGSVCLTNNMQLSLNVVGGSSPFTYNWTGPASFSSASAIASITNNGNYAVTLTDAYGCSVNTNGFVYQKFEPLIISLQTKICEGNSINLNATTSGGISYLWSPNAGNAITPNVTVTPVFPSSSYFVTVTNDLGCSAVANASIDVDAKPVVSISGNNTICVGGTTTLSPSTGGTWTSNNPAIASVSNNGIVSAIAAGTSTFVFTNSTTNCSSNNSPIVTVEAKPTLTFSGPNNICIGGSSNILPASGGTWSSSNVGVATINNQGLINGVAAGNVNFTFTSNNSSCGSSTSTIFSVTPKPIVDIVGARIFCIGQTTNLVPTSGGTWVSNDPTIALVSNLGVVTALSNGTATFTFTNFSGCSSEPTAFVTINQKPTVIFSGPTSVCIGESSQITPSTNGIWSSSNSAVATITNAGVINAVAPGIATFTYTNSTTTCTSNPSQDFTVIAKPNPGFTGPSSLCIGGTTTVTPTSGGTWTSTNPSISTVSNAGIVNGILPGTSSLIFTNTATGCSAQIVTPVSVYSKPPTVITGPNSICIGENTTITPSSGGFWVSSNPSVATITNSGIITGVGQGTANFTYFESGSGCSSDPSTNITIGNRPTISITGPTTICEGLTTMLSPTSGGSWVSSNPQVASVDNTGLVTGLMQGTASFTFISNTGCTSLVSNPITINGKPTPVYNGPSSLCIGENTNISPSVGGTWISNNPSRASITNEGIITALTAGTATFTFTEQNTGCTSNASGILLINENPVLSLNGPDNICIGTLTNVFPSSGGIWSSSNPNAVSINNQGLVFGLLDGTATLSYINYTTGCESLTPITITVNAKPVVSILGPNNICIGATTTLSPATGGSWTSLNPSIASVNNNGVVTGLSQGLARFTFLDGQTGCTSNNTLPIVVNGNPTISIGGQNEICIGGNTQLSPSVGGTWISINSNIATVTSNGLVTGVANGVVGFAFTEASSGCTSTTNSSAISVISSEQPYIDGTSEICLGYQTRIHPSVGVTWISSNPKVATVSNDGIVTGKAPGRVTFTYTSAQTGCSASLPNDAITVKNCVDPDFNVTSINIPVTGNVSTNDDVPAGTTWGPPMVVNKPSGSISNFTMNSDGTYNFVANTKGIYEYRVPVCILPLTFGCPSATIIITVLDPLDVNNKTVANLDLATVYTGSDVWMNALANDKCINNVNCLIDAQSMQSMKITLKGDVTNGITGGFDYEPHNTEVGQDTIVYKVCVTGEPSNCVESRQYITINAANALNSTVASDDFFSTFSGVAVIGNVLTNDTDPENNTQTILTQGTASSQITLPQGKYYIDATGNLYFTPTTNFSGPVDIIYTVCDDNPNSICASATAHILVLGDMTLGIRSYLEGALISNNDVMEGGVHLMRDDLRNNPFDGNNYIPIKDPYKFGTEFVTINEKYTYEMPGILPIFEKITDSATVFSVTGRNAIVDWVFVELRSKTDASDVIATRSGLIQRDGDIVDLDGISKLKFPQVNFDSFYVAVRHRNHLGVMSLKVANGQLVDFTNPSTPIFDFGTIIAGLDYTGLAMNNNVKFGVRAMWGGDFDGNRKVKFTNPADDQNILFFDVFSDPDNISGNANFNNTMGYYQGDYNMNGKSKYDNPNDDKNLLFSQILFYPLNTQYLSNFNFFIEQIP